MSDTPLFDVMAVDIEDSIIRWIVTDKTEDNADAIVKMAVMRQGVDEQFYSIEPAGKYQVGDRWSYRPAEKHYPEFCQCSKCAGPSEEATIREHDEKQRRLPPSQRMRPAKMTKPRGVRR